MFNPYIGLCKFILAVLVVAIHVEPFTGNLAFYYNNCLARIADPMFFTLSAYFLFDKLVASNWDASIFKKQIQRLCQYYGVWLVIYAPIILSRTWARADSWLTFIGEIFKQIFLSGPYGALWFLPALILGLILTYYIGKWTTPRICLVLSLPFFLLSVLQMEYFALIKDIAWLTACNNFFVGIFGWLGNGINFAWFFCAIGLYLATEKQKEKPFRIYVRDCINFVTILAVECTLIRRYNLGISYGVMLSLIPVTYYLMKVLLGLPKVMQAADIKQNSSNATAKLTSMKQKDTFAAHAKYLQDMSLLIFPLHYGIMEAMEYLMRDSFWYMSSTAIQYVIVLLLTFGISAMILALGKRYRTVRLLYGKY